MMPSLVVAICIVLMKAFIEPQDGCAESDGVDYCRAKRASYGSGFNYRHTPPSGSALTFSANCPIFDRSQVGDYVKRHLTFAPALTEISFQMEPLMRYIVILAEQPVSSTRLAPIVFSGFTKWPSDY